MPVFEIARSRITRRAFEPSTAWGCLLATASNIGHVREGAGKCLIIHMQVRVEGPRAERLLES
eukprot:12861663-Alexandrium_andersonii.AAC.1